jgi:6-pyruvoyl-tetrahydropterin synthase
LPKQSIAPKFTASPYIGATGSFGGSQIPTTFAAPASSKLTDHIYTWADKFVDLKNLQKEIEATIGQLDDQYNAYQKEELYHAKVAKQYKDFMRQEVLPLYNAMKEENVTPEKLNEYVHNRHAEERNDQIDKVNQGVVQGIVGKGSGIATKDARDYLNNLTAQETASLDRVAKMLDGIMQKTRALMVSSGLEEQGTIDAWEKTYTYYVPLERVLGDPDETNTGFTGQGQGYSVSKSVKRAMGSTLDVEHIIANILATRERTIVRAEKNEIDKAIYALALKAPNPNIWIAVDPELPRNKRKNLASFLATFGGFTIKEAQNIAAFPETRSIDRQTGHVKKGRNPQLAKADNVLHLMIDGKEKLVFFNSRNKQANRLVRTLKNLDTANLARGLQTVGAITRYFSAVNTQYNPIFGVINLIRDVQTGFINLESTPIAGMQKQVAGDFMPAIKGIWSQLRAEAKGGSGTGPWAALFKEFEQYGGPTGYRDMFANPDDRAKMIESEIKALSQGKAKAALSGIGSMLSDYNTAFENGVRLAAYKAAIDKGE